MLVCDDVESNHGPGAGRGARVLYTNIRGLHANLTELSVVGSKFDVMVCAETKVSDRRPLGTPFGTSDHCESTVSYLLSRSYQSTILDASFTLDIE